jgi:hypothetical protein
VAGAGLGSDSPEPIVPHFDQLTMCAFDPDWTVGNDQSINDAPTEPQQGQRGRRGFAGNKAVDHGASVVKLRSSLGPDGPPARSHHRWTQPQSRLPNEIHVVSK